MISTLKVSWIKVIYIYSPLPLNFLYKISLLILYYIIYFTNVTKETFGNFSIEVGYLKVGLLPSKQVGFIYFNESPLKMMNNALYLMLRWLLGLRKLRFSEKIETLQIGLILRVAWWENIFYYGWKKQRFFLIFTMELFSTALSYLTAQSTLNFTWTFLYF